MKRSRPPPPTHFPFLTRDIVSKRPHRGRVQVPPLPLSLPPGTVAKVGGSPAPAAVAASADDTISEAGTPGVPPPHATSCASFSPLMTTGKAMMELTAAAEASQAAAAESSAAGAFTNPPTYAGDAGSLSYKKTVRLWWQVTTVPPLNQASVLLTDLSGDALDHARSMEFNDFVAADNMDGLMERLEGQFGASPGWSIVAAFCTLHACSRCTRRCRPFASLLLPRSACWTRSGSLWPLTTRRTSCTAWRGSPTTNKPWSSRTPPPARRPG